MEALDQVLVDTDVLIDFLRRREPARKFLNDIDKKPYTSTIVVAELYGGVREGTERATLSALLETFNIVPVNFEIAVQGGLYHRDFRKSHGTGFSDALIAATAIQNDLTLVTLNTKHYPMLDKVHRPY